MNDRQLTSFLKIAETGSFSKAAQESFLSVPALVQQMDRMEDDLGFRVFSRTNQGVKLTEQGKIFYQAVLEMQEIYENAVEKIRRVEQNTITIGVAPEQCPEFLMNACAAFQAKDSGRKLHFVESPYENHLELLRAQKIDLTVIAKPKAAFLNGLVYEKLCQDTFSFGISKGDTSALEKRIAQKDLRGIPVFCGTYHYMEKSFEEGLKETGAVIKTLNTEYNLESRVQARFSDSMLVFHSQWKNCYAHMFQILPSEIPAGSIGIVMRKGEENRLAGITAELHHVL